MIQRFSYQLIAEYLEDFPVVGIVGARQVGKTTLAKSLVDDNSVYVDLESDLDEGVLSQPGLFLRQNNHKRIIIDEVQRMPQLFPLLRSIVDEDSRPGRIILLGSASPQLLRESSETLAGRIAYVELSGLNMLEVGPDHTLPLWNRGGFPKSFLAKSDQSSLNWRKQFIKSYIERDLPLLGLDANHKVLTRLLQILASLTGQPMNASSIAKALGVSPPTVRRYVDFLENSFLIRSLPPYHLNIKKRLVKSPKLYFNDIGAMHALLNIANHNELMGHFIAGFSWENFAIRQIQSVAEDQYECYFYRTQEGTESDLLLTQADQPKYAIEFKLAPSPKPTKGTHQAIRDLGAAQNFIITPESRRYAINDNLEVISLQDFLELLKKA